MSNSKPVRHDDGFWQRLTWPLSGFNDDYMQSDALGNYSRRYVWSANQLGHVTLGMITAIFIFGATLLMPRIIQRLMDALNSLGAAKIVWNDPVGLRTIPIWVTVASVVFVIIGLVALGYWVRSLWRQIGKARQEGGSVWRFNPRADHFATVANFVIAIAPFALIFFINRDNIYWFARLTVDDPTLLGDASQFWGGATADTQGFGRVQYYELTSQLVIISLLSLGTFFISRQNHIRFAAVSFALFALVAYAVVSEVVVAVLQIENVTVADLRPLGGVLEGVLSPEWAILAVVAGYTFGVMAVISIVGWQGVRIMTKHKVTWRATSMLIFILGCFSAFFVGLAFDTSLALTGTVLIWFTKEFGSDMERERIDLERAQEERRSGGFAEADHEYRRDVLADVRADARFYVFGALIGAALVLSIDFIAEQNRIAIEGNLPAVSVDSVYDASETIMPMVRVWYAAFDPVYQLFEGWRDRGRAFSLETAFIFIFLTVLAFYIYYALYGHRWILRARALDMCGVAEAGRLSFVKSTLWISTLRLDGEETSAVPPAYRGAGPADATPAPSDCLLAFARGELESAAGGGPVRHMVLVGDPDSGAEALGRVLSSEAALCNIPPPGVPSDRPLSKPRLVRHAVALDIAATGCPPIDHEAPDLVVISRAHPFFSADLRQATGDIGDGLLRVMIRKIFGEIEKCSAQAALDKSAEVQTLWVVDTPAELIDRSEDSAVLREQAEEFRSALADVLMDRGRPGDEAISIVMVQH